MPVGDPNVVKQLEAPVPWIGLYAAAASAICTLAMAADILRGFRSRKYWFPSKYFSLNATSLTLLAVAMKLPMDLTTKMYSTTDRLAKVSSISFMAITTANFLTSLGSMDDKSLLMSVVALGILVITIVGNVCIQIIQMRSFLNSRRALWEESLAMASMLLLLFMFISSALTITSTKQQLKTMYHERHKLAKKDGNLADMRRATTRKLRVFIRKYWVMAETSSPQFVIARSVTGTVSGIVTLLVAIILVEAEIRIAMKEGIFDQTYSSYKKSTRGILLSQTIGVIVGAIAPISRWFVAINHGCRVNSENAFTVESYWTEKLVEWRQSSLSVEIRHLKTRKALHDLKGLMMKLSISVQHLIVLTSKLVLVVSIWMTRSITRYDSGSEGSMTNAEKDIRRYVIQLEGEVELPAETLRNMFKEMNETIQKGKTRKPKSLLELLSKSCNFNGVRDFDSNHQDPPQIHNCWSLPVVTLTCIALAIPNVDKDKSEWLLHSVTEGLRYVKLTDKLLDKKGQLAKVRAAADEVYVGVELKRKWLDMKLDDIAAEGENAKEILQHLVQYSERKVVKFKKDPRYWPRKAIAANSMYRVSKTMLINHGGGTSAETDKDLFEKLSIMIADILAACLTNLPRAITKMCHRDAIEKREKGVRRAAMYLGETKDIIEVLQTCDLPTDLTPNKAAYIEEWRAKYRKMVSTPEPTVTSATCSKSATVTAHARVSDSNTCSGSYAQAVRHSFTDRHPDIFISSMARIQPIRRGEFSSISVPDDLYQSQILKFQYSLIGRLILAKGDKPWPAPDLKSKMQSLWGVSEDWRLISLGKGYFTIQLSSKLDQEKVQRLQTWNLRPGILRLRDWVPDFTPYDVKSSTAQVWLRIYNLPIEFWHEDILVGIARSVGVPLKLDGNSLSGSLGHFARVLVEVDMTQKLQEAVMIDRGEASFFVDIQYENLPRFCSVCQLVEHDTGSCSKSRSGDTGMHQEAAKGSKIVEPRPNEKSGPSTKEWVVKNFGKGVKGNCAHETVPIVTANQFSIFQNTDGACPSSAVNGDVGLGIDESTEPLAVEEDMVVDRHVAVVLLLAGLEMAKDSSLEIEEPVAVSASAGEAAAGVLTVNDRDVEGMAVLSVDVEDTASAEGSAGAGAEVCAGDSGCGDITLVAVSTGSGDIEASTSACSSAGADAVDAPAGDGDIVALAEGNLTGKEAGIEDFGGSKDAAQVISNKVIKATKRRYTKRGSVPLEERRRSGSTTEGGVCYREDSEDLTSYALMAPTTKALKNMDLISSLFAAPEGKK